MALFPGSALLPHARISLSHLWHGADWISAARRLLGTGLEGDAIDEAKSWANIEAQFIEKIKPLIEAGTQSDYRGAQGESLLHVAASNGWVDAAKLLIEAKVRTRPCIQWRRYVGVTWLCPRWGQG